MNFRIHGRVALLATALILLPLAACSKQDDAPSDGGMPPGFGNAAQNMSAADLETWEKRDLGVKAQNKLHGGAAHGPTPTEIPGGKLITTRELLTLQQSAGQKLVLLEVLGAPQTLPNAFRAVPAAAPGDFNDQTQQQFAQVLQQLTQGDRNAPIVTYCANPECWMSYNAALRAINAGYGNVHWYRGGLEAWERAGQPVSGGQQPMQGPQGPHPAGPSPMPREDMGQPQPGGYPQQPGGSPPQQVGYPQQPGGYPPQQDGYPQQPGGYPPQQGSDLQQPGGYPPQQGGYPQQPGGYPPQQGGYPQQPGGYPPQQGGYPQQPGGYPPQQGGYPQQPGGYPPQQGSDLQQPGGYPPQQGGYPQQPAYPQN